MKRLATQSWFPSRSAAIVRLFAKSSNDINRFICGLTFAACGDLHISEDLAQETFLQAWTHLAELKDASRLRSWLCGIARNLAASDRRQRTRTPIVESELLDQTPSTGTASPPNQAIAREEQAIIWRALQRLPIDYREPLVLYYRQQESVAQMAAALEISDEAARQRLVRGRAMLAHHLDVLVDRGLRTSAPTRAFTLAVIAALPAATLSAKASARWARRSREVRRSRRPPLLDSGVWPCWAQRWECSARTRDIAPA